MKKDGKSLWVLTAITLSMVLVTGCTSMIGFKDSQRSAEGPGEFNRPPGYYTVWTESGGGDGNIIFWAGKSKSGYITIDKIYMNTAPSMEGAVVVMDFTANPFVTPDSLYWWANFESWVNGGKFSFGSSGGEKWGGGFNPRNFKDFSYIGFSVLLDKTAYPRLGDVLLELDGENIYFADLVKQQILEE